jgi:hypothetical protein
VFDDVLGREFQVGSVTWSTASASGTQLAAFDFPSVLFAQPFIASKIEYFAYFRAGIRLSIRVTANRYLYGKLITYYCPVANANSYNPATALEASGSPHVLTSASASEVTIMDVPFIYPKRAIQINGATSEMGSFRMLVLNPLTSVTGDADNGQVVVMAQFVAPEMYYPHDVFVTESNPSEAEVKTEKHSIADSLIQHKGVSSMLSHARRIMKNTYSHVTHTVLGEVATTLAMSMAGLSKPVTLDMTAVNKINPFRDTASGRGMDSVVKLAMDPENAVTVTPNVGGSTVDEMALSHIIGTPMISAVWPFTAVSPAAPIAYAGMVDGLVGQTFVDIVANNFAFWSGSFKFKIYFTASQFHNIRAVLWIQYGAGAEGEWVNCYHRVVEISGDVEIEFTVPYLSREVVSSIVDGQFIWFKILSWSQPDPALTCPLYLNVYKAAGPDMRFGMLQETTWTLQSNPRADFQKEFPMFQPSMRSYLHEGFVFGERYESLREILARYHALSATTVESLVVWDPITGTTTPEKWAYLFRFYRGSMRFKLMLAKGSTETRAAYLTVPNLSGNLQGFTLSSSLNPVIEVEAPYYHPQFFERADTNSAADYALQISAKTGEGVFVSKAMGDDFSLFFLRYRPVEVAKLLNPPSQGQNALRDFVIT